uniref:Uncharacterized protein n=1 Tax=Knipowitschia caucasica TaxID=637954 RepID=A0AAV2JEI2_KNICA
MGLPDLDQVVGGAQSLQADVSEFRSIRPSISFSAADGSVLGLGAIHTAPEIERGRRRGTGSPPYSPESPRGQKRGTGPTQEEQRRGTGPNQEDQRREVVPLHHTVPGHSKDSLTFEYLPLHAAMSPHLEKVVHFSASLGTSHSVTVKFTNFSRTRTEYSCKTDCPDFLVDKKVTDAVGLQSGSETSVDVCFEPHQLGEVKTQLTLHSPAGGEYIFPLHGVCDDPKPQGPFYMAAGQIVHIPFKNVFLQNTIFTYKVNNPSFTVKGPETIRSKSTENVLVSFESPPEGGSGPWFGRLTISSEPSNVHAKSCSWTFYLNGYRPVLP